MLRIFGFGYSQGCHAGRLRRQGAVQRSLQWPGTAWGGSPIPYRPPNTPAGAAFRGEIFPAGHHYGKRVLSDPNPVQRNTERTTRMGDEVATAKGTPRCLR